MESKTSEISLAVPHDDELSTTETPPIQELTPITVDGVTFILIDGQWYFYLTPELKAQIKANPSEEFPASRIAIAAVNAHVVSQENLVACAQKIGEQQGFTVSGYNSQKVLNIFAIDDIFYLPQEECIAVAQVDSLPQLDLQNPETQVGLGVLMVSGVLTVALLLRRAHMTWQHFKETQSGSSVDIPDDLGDERPLNSPIAEERRQQRIQQTRRRREVMHVLGPLSDSQLAKLGLNPDYSAIRGDDEAQWNILLKEHDDEKIRSTIRTETTPGPIDNFRQKWRSVFGRKK